MGDGDQRGRRTNGGWCAEKEKLRGEVICDDRMRKGKQRGSKRERQRRRKQLRYDQ